MINSKQPRRLSELDCLRRLRQRFLRVSQPTPAAPLVFGGPAVLLLDSALLDSEGPARPAPRNPTEQVTLQPRTTSVDFPYRYRFRRLFPQALICLVLLHLSPPLAAAEGLVINEIMSLNRDFLTDGDGDFSDWFELYNGSGEAMNLGGYAVSDDPSKGLAPADDSTGRSHDSSR